jgi:hypothetical protein
VVTGVFACHVAHQQFRLFKKFLLSTPGLWLFGEWYPLPLPTDATGFLMKNFFLLGAAVWTGGEALRSVGRGSENARRVHANPAEPTHERDDLFQSQAWSGDWQGTLPIQEPMSQVRGNSLAKFRGGGADNPHYKARMPSAQVEMFSKSSHFQGQSDNALFCFKMLVRSCVREDEVVSEF